MDLTPLQELKQKLLHDVLLPPVWSFFLDHFGHNPDFIALGERTQHPFVEAVVAQVGQQLFPRDAALGHLLLGRIRDQHFIHGGFSLGGRMGGVIYFEDARIGLLAVADLPPSIDVKYVRFAGQKISAQAKPSAN